MEGSKGGRYWTPHDEHSWLPCSLLESNANTVTLKAGPDFGGEVIELPAKALTGLAQVDPQQEAGVDDICALQSVSEAALLHTVRTRYLKDIIYTRVARVLIALNPFRALPIYSSQFTDQYMAAADSTDLAPHIYGLSKDAIKGLRETTRDQAVLISGESGAGKTESAKLVLSFVTDAVRTGQGSIVEQVCQTSPVLEAFGNAMTVRNNNSSRFGKWLDLRFSQSLELRGCSLTSYLLETTRVCSQSPGERGFHVFFQLLQARDTPALAPLGLKDPTHYRYLHGAQLIAPGIDDTACFEELADALSVVGFDHDTRLEIFKAVAGVLALGNVEFKDADQAQVDDEATSRQAAELLGVDADRLLKCMTVKKITVGVEQMMSPLSPDQARAARDALARLFYGQLFLWLIQRINKTLCVPTAAQADAGTAAGERLLGVLDIAGFESFEFNSLEQLLINLSNEHLQQNFNTVVFKQEIKDCEEEGIKPSSNLGFMDNSDCLALIDGKGGILDLLDETMAMPKSTNQAYVDKATKQQAGHKRFITSKIAFLGFGIQHYAGGVTYGCEGWLEKNANRSPTDAVQLLGSSASSVLAEIGKNMAVAEGAGSSKPSRGAAKKVKSVTAQFRASLHSLMAKITEASPHYIRCIKPNMEKVPGRIVGRMAMEQLLLSGVLATVRIRQQGYAVRMTHSAFDSEYRMLAWLSGKGAKPAKGAADGDGKTKAEALIQTLVGCVPAFKEAGPQAYAVGTSKVFLKVGAAKALDDARGQALFALVMKVQSVMRGRLARKTTTPWRKIAEGIRTLLKRTGLDTPARASLSGTQTRGSRASLRRVTSWSGESVLSQLGSPQKAREVLAEFGALLQQAEEAGFQNVEVLAAKRVQRRMQHELEASEDLERLRASIDAVEIEKAVARARSLRLPRDSGLSALEERMERLRAQQPLVQAMTAALEECSKGGALSDDSLAQLREIEEAVKEAGLEGGSGAWLKELGGAELFSKVSEHLKAHDKSQQPAEAAEPQQGEAAAAQQDARPRLKRGLTRGRTLIFNEACEKSSQQIRKDLNRAALEFDSRALEGLLRRADELGMRDEDQEGADGESDDETSGAVGNARRVFEQLQSVDFVVACIDSACTEVAKPEPSMEALLRLEHLSRQLRGLPGYEEEAADAFRSLRRGLVKRSTRHYRRSVFEAKDSMELELANEAFSKLLGFPELKQVWTIQKSGAAGSSGSPISHSKACLDEAMTLAPSDANIEAFEAAAVQNFRNVLVCMGDRPAQECQRQASREAILELATVNDWGIRNEVYIQVMKQLVACPRERTARLGWVLLQKLCMQAPPSSEAAEFVRQLINGYSEGRPNDRETVAIARSCLGILEGADDDASPSGAAGEDDSGWTPGITRLKAENTRLRALSKKQASDIDRLNSELERLRAEVVRLGGRPTLGTRTAPHQPEVSTAEAMSPEEAELCELKRQALERGMLYRQVADKSAEELSRWLKQQATSAPAPMASAPRGGPSPVRFMDLPDSDSDVEIDLSEFASA